METINIDKKSFIELVKLNEELQEKLESLVLMADSKFVESYKKAKKEIENGEVVDFDDL